MLQSSAKQMAALDPIMDSIQTTLRGFETIANEIESDIVAVERKSVIHLIIQSFINLLLIRLRKIYHKHYALLMIVRPGDLRM